MSGEIGFGMEIAYSDTQNGSYTDVALVTEVVAPAIDVPEVQKTHHGSSSYAHEFTPGLINGGEISFKILFAKAQHNTLYGLIRTEKWWRIEFPLESGESSQSNWKCAGYLKGIQNLTPMEDKMEVQITIKLTGKPVWTSGS